jgi:hypothetical protein
VPADSTLHLERIPYFRKYEVVNKYELGRYITPYGNGLSLGNGFDWVYDVTDYAPLLHDTVHLQAFNQQEMVDLSFEMIEGTPAREELGIQNVWSGTPAYGTSTSIENFLAPRKIYVPANVKGVRLKMRTTGHGFGGTDNCSEFCPRVHTIKVNGVARFDTTVFRNDCGLNPIYPQGGTWLYNRSNWCPGASVPTYDLELTPFVTPGDSMTLDYDIEPYTWDGQGTTPYYDIETQLVYYGEPSYGVDAELEAVKSPSTTDMYKRMNPICTDPVITIRNNGSTPLTKLQIRYGVTGAPQQTYNWTGNLKFLESEDVHLGHVDTWAGNTFSVALASPNDGDDENPSNDTMQTSYVAPPVYPADVVFELKTNNNGDEESYEIRDANGNVVHSRSGLDGATVYADTLHLAPGCYEFRLTDAGGDGLSWWANTAAGAGYMRVRRATSTGIITTFNPDFGTEIYQQFTVASSSDVKEAPPEAADDFSLSPNPTTGQLRLDLSLRHRQDVAVTVEDVRGSEVLSRVYKGVSSGPITLDLSSMSKGVYVVSVATSTSTITRKVVLR